MGRQDTHTAEILRLCSDPAGKTMPQVAALCGAARATVNTKLPALYNAGKLYRAGKRKGYHYFTHQAHALAWQQQQEAAAASQGPRMDPRDLYTDKILKACSAPCGRTSPEITKLSGAALGTLGAKLPKMVASGLLHRRGTARQYRYFTHLAHAEAWARGETAPATTSSTPKPKHGPSISLGNNRPGLDTLPAGGTVTWPENVRVTVAPTYRDTRFTFDPPPGWRGELMREWEQRRKAA